MYTALESERLREIVGDAKRRADSARAASELETSDRDQLAADVGDISCLQLHLAAVQAYLKSAEAYLRGNPSVGQMYSAAGDILSGAATACESIPSSFEALRADAKNGANAARQEAIDLEPSGKQPVAAADADPGCSLLHLAAALAYLDSASAYLAGDQLAGMAYSSAGDLLVAEAIACELAVSMLPTTWLGGAAPSY